MEQDLQIFSVVVGRRSLRSQSNSLKVFLPLRKSSSTSRECTTANMVVQIFVRPDPVHHGHRVCFLGSRKWHTVHHLTHLRVRLQKAVTTTYCDGHAGSTPHHKVAAPLSHRRPKPASTHPSTTPSPALAQLWAEKSSAMIISKRLRVVCGSSCCRSISITSTER